MVKSIRDMQFWAPLSYKTEHMKATVKKSRVRNNYLFYFEFSYKPLNFPPVVLITHDALKIVKGSMLELPQREYIVPATVRPPSHEK